MAYSVTTTYVMDRAIIIKDAICMITGKIDVSNYNTAHVEITAITNKFDTVMSVVAAVTDNGYFLQWSPSTKAFKGWEATGNAGALEEADSADDLGEAYFVAIGIKKSAW